MCAITLELDSFGIGEAPDASALENKVQILLGILLPIVLHRIYLYNYHACINEG